MEDENAVVLNNVAEFEETTDLQPGGQIVADNVDAKRTVLLTLPLIRADNAVSETMDSHPGPQILADNVDAERTDSLTLPLIRADNAVSEGANAAVVNNIAQIERVDLPAVPQINAANAVPQVDLQAVPQTSDANAVPQVNLPAVPQPNAANAVPQGPNVTDQVLAQFADRIDANRFLEIWASNPGAETAQVDFLCTVSLFEEREMWENDELNWWFNVVVADLVFNKILAFFDFLAAIPLSSLNRGTFFSYQFVVRSPVEVRTAAFLRECGIWTGVALSRGGSVVMAEVEEECTRVGIPLV